MDRQWFDEVGAFMEEHGVYSKMPGDDGYRSVAFEVGAQLEAALKKIAQLRAALEKIAEWDCLSVQAKTGMTLMSQVGLIQATAQAALAEQPAE